MRRIDNAVGQALLYAAAFALGSLLFLVGVTCITLAGHVMLHGL
jgi:uncharacterized membrane protein